jgi:hypothetical protein
MVRGKNGRWLGLSCTVAATNTTVSPNCTRQDPWAFLAMRPNSRLNVRPANWRSILWIISLFSLLSGGRDHPVTHYDPVGAFSRSGIPSRGPKRNRPPQRGHEMPGRMQQFGWADSPGSCCLESRAKALCGRRSNYPPLNSCGVPTATD